MGLKRSWQRRKQAERDKDTLIKELQWKLKKAEQKNESIAKARGE